MNNHSQNLQLKDELYKSIGLAKSVKQLYVIPEFKQVYENYTSVYALGLMEELAQYSIGSKEHQSLIEKLNAISHFKSYLNNLIEQGQWANFELNELSTNPDNGDDENV